MKALITVVALALIAWGIFALTRGESEMAIPDVNQSTNSTTTPEGAAGGTELATREFTVTGKNFSFAPSVMSVNKGERVRITFVNDVGTHDLVVEGYDARTQILQGGQSETIEFIADEAGTFEYYCSVGSHREMGMVGTLTVTDVE